LDLKADAWHAELMRTCRMHPEERVQEAAVSAGRWPKGYISLPTQFYFTADAV